MTEAVKDWVRDIFIVVMILGFVEIVLPDGGMRKFVKFVFSIIIVGTVLSPINYFTGNDITSQALAEEYSEFFQERAEQSESDNNDNYDGVEQSEKFNEIQDRMIERMYKEKIVSEVKSCIGEYYPDTEIYDVEIYMNESEKESENQLASLNKIVIIGEETEYVSNITRCVAQSLEIEDGRILYSVYQERKND